MEIGYYNQFGYKVLVRGRWMLFATRDDYLEYVEEEEFDRDHTRKSPAAV